MFKQRMWMIPLAHWIGIAAVCLCLGMLIAGARTSWALLWVVGQICGSLAVSVGLHRYFTHGSFVTSPFWHKVMAVYSTLTVQGSPLGWAAAHQTHHEKSDQPGDPHFTHWSYLFNKRYNAVRMEHWRLRMLISDPTLAFVHRYAVLIILAWVVLLTAIGYATKTGFGPLLFGYLAPLGTTHMIGAVHQVISHKGGAPRDLTVMEWLLPAMGEWQHKHHHDHPRDWRYGSRWYHLDLGAIFISAIKVD